MAPRKKKLAASSSESLYTDYNEQPWVTGHLKGENIPMTPLREREEREQWQASSGAEEDEDAILPMPPKRAHIRTNDYAIHDFAGHSNVTIPATPKRLRTLSELIDPDEIAPNSHVRTPSGQMLNREQYMMREDRPMSIKERQTAIRAKIAAEKRARLTQQSREAVKLRRGTERQGMLKEQKSLSDMGAFGNRVEIEYAPPPRKLRPWEEKDMVELLAEDDFILCGCKAQ